ncbi:MAG: YezD family protein [Verrucomicrobiota bacterium]
MSKSVLTSTAESPEPWVEIVRQKLAGMRFGSIQLIVHEGRVTQVESLEKTRIPTELTVASGK